MAREQGVIVVVWRRTSALEVLLLHRSHFGRGFAGDWGWTTPGGGKQPDESAAGAAERELREETGLALRLVPVQSEIADRQPGIDVTVFAAQAPSNAEVVLSDEHDEFEWVGVEGLSRCLPEWVHAAYLEVLQRI